jgi:hypothetical protein
MGTLTRAGALFAGAGGGLVLRSRTGVGLELGAAVGARQGDLAGRGEALLSFSLDPLRERGIAPYLAGGVALLATANGTAEYAVVTLGLESNPGRATGWFVEAGVGGGLRCAVGLAFRHRSL